MRTGWEDLKICPLTCPEFAAREDSGLGQVTGYDMAKDQRKKNRMDVRREACVRVSDGFATRRCVIEDQSDTGVCVKLDSPTFLSDQFLLLPTGRSGPTRACRIKWRRGSLIGAEFVVS
jgi:hypothetical protein